MIRKYKASDEDKFCKLVMSQWDDRRQYDIYEYDKLDPYFWIDHRLYNSDYVTLVDSALQSFICGHRRDYYMEVDSLYVHLQKRRQGLALALKQQLTALAKEEGFNYIVAYNIISNDKSRKMNIKAGWKIEPYDGDYYKASKRLI